MHCESESELGAVYEHDLSNKGERNLGTANASLTDDRSVRLWVSGTGFGGVKFFMASCVKTLIVYNW